MIIIASLAVATLMAVLLWPRKVSAHCDTPEGPVIIDGKKALESGSVDIALKWVNQEAEAEVSHAFELCSKVRGLSEDARKVADHHFLETLVRLHRASEGEPYTGIKSAGTPASPTVAAADTSVESGSIDELLKLVNIDKHEELKKRFETMLEAKNYEASDIEAGRKFVEAYVKFVKFAAGQNHESVESHEQHSATHSC